MFEQAGAVDAASDIRREQDKLAMRTNTILSPEILEHDYADRASNALFDIPSFWDEAVRAPLREFPILYMLTNTRIGTLHFLK